MSELTNATRDSADRDDDDVVLAATPVTESDLSNILIIEPDADRADALETILAELPGIATVQTAMTAGDVFDLFDDGSYDVVGFEMSHGAAPVPDVIFIGAHQPDADDADTALAETLTTFRGRVPYASIVLLSVYPDRYRTLLGGLIDSCIRADTSARELRELIDTLRTSRAVA